MRILPPNRLSLIKIPLRLFTSFSFRHDSLAKTGQNPHQGFFRTFISFLALLLLSSCSGLRLHDEKLYQLSQSAEKTWSEYTSRPLTEQMLSNAIAFQSLGTQVAEVQQEGVAFAAIKDIKGKDWEYVERKTAEKLVEYFKEYEQAEEEGRIAEDELKKLNIGLLRARKAIDELEKDIEKLKKDQKDKKATGEVIRNLTKLIDELKEALSDKPEEVKKKGKQGKDLITKVEESNILEILKKYKDFQDIWKELSKEEVLSTRIILLRIALDRAVAEKDRLQIEKGYYEYKLRALRERQEVGKQVRRLAEFIHGVISKEGIEKKSQIIEDLRRLSKPQTDDKELVKRLEVLSSYVFLINRCDRWEPLRAQRDTYEEMWLKDLRISQVNALEHQRFVADGLSGLTVYHKGGITEEDIGLMVGLVEGITALAILEKE